MAVYALCNRPNVPMKQTVALRRKPKGASQWIYSAATDRGFSAGEEAALLAAGATLMTHTEALTLAGQWDEMMPPDVGFRAVGPP